MENNLESKKYSVYFGGKCVIEATNKEDAECQFYDFLKTFNERNDMPSNVIEILCASYAVTETPCDREFDQE